MSMKQEVAISPVGTVEYMAPEVNSIYNQSRAAWKQWLPVRRLMAYTCLYVDIRNTNQ